MVMVRVRIRVRVRVALLQEPRELRSGHRLAVVGRLVGGVAERGHAHEARVVLHVRIGVVADVLATEQPCVIPGERAKRRVRGTEGVWEGRGRGKVGGGGGGLRLRAFSF